MEPSGKASAESQSSGSPREYILKQGKAARMMGQSRTPVGRGAECFSSSATAQSPSCTAGHCRSVRRGHPTQGHSAGPACSQQREGTVRTKPLTPISEVLQRPLGVTPVSSLSQRRKSFPKASSSQQVTNPPSRRLLQADSSVSPPPLQLL